MDKLTAEKIKLYFKENREALVNDLILLMNADSPTGNVEACNKCADVLCGLIKDRLGVEATRIPQEKFGDHITFETGSGDESMLLIGHYDTVWPVGAKETTYDGNIVKGAGCFDMKYGDISIIWALKAISDLGIPLKNKIKVVYNSDEEFGSLTSKPIILNMVKGCKAAVVLEPASEGALKTERKGVGMITVDIEGIPSHAGTDYTKGVSAIDEAAKIVSYLHSLTDLEKGTTVNVGMISGGTARNVVAAACTLKVDFRVTTAAAAEELSEKVNAIRPSREGIKLNVSFELNRPPFERTPGNVMVYEFAGKLAADLGYEISEIAVGGGSDGNFTSFEGIPTLDGLGSIGAGGHAWHEYTDIDKSLERTAILCGFLTEF